MRVGAPQRSWAWFPHQVWMNLPGLRAQREIRVRQGMDRVVFVPALLS
jgi:hypothetical protein